MCAIFFEQFSPKPVEVFMTQASESPNQNPDEPHVADTTATTKVVSFRGNRVRIYSSKNGKYRNCRLVWRAGGSTYRKTMTDADAAVDRAKEIVRGLASDELESLERYSREYLVDCERSLGGLDLRKAVDFFQANRDKFEATIVGLALRLTSELERKLGSGGQGYTQLLKEHISLWKQWLEYRTLESVSVEEVTRLLAEAKVSPIEKRNLLRALEMLENFAIKHGHVALGYKRLTDSLNPEAIGASDQNLSPHKNETNTKQLTGAHYMPGKLKNGTTRLSYIERSDKKRAMDLLAAIRGTTLSALIQDATEQYLNREDPAGDILQQLSSKH